MPAFWILLGVGKSGWPMQNETMSLPCLASALTSASTTNAFSVPSDSARRESFVAVDPLSCGAFTRPPGLRPPSSCVLHPDLRAHGRFLLPLAIEVAEGSSLWRRQVAFLGPAS